MDVEGKGKTLEGVQTTSNDTSVDKAFAIEDYYLADTATMTVLRPDRKGPLTGLDKKNPVQIEFFSSGTTQAVKAAHRAGTRAQERIFNVYRGKFDPKAAEKADAEAVDKLVARTARVINFPLNAEQIFANHKLGYITTQAQEFVDDDANFTNSSTPSLQST